MSQSPRRPASLDVGLTIADRRRRAARAGVCAFSYGRDVADRSSIEWTGATWNPVTGCDRISAGCDHCYALTLANRLKAMGNPKYQTDGDPRTSGPGFGIAIHEGALELPRRWASSRTVFVNSMSDLFHARVHSEFIFRVFEVMADTPRHTYQVLTKRPLRLARLASSLPWPPNVWIGVSVESQQTAWRLDPLRKVPGAVRFVSAEPLIGPVTLNLEGIDWLIVGGESGHQARPMRAEWVRSLQRDSEAADVAFFFKQWGGRTPKAGGRTLDGRTWDFMPRPALHRWGPVGAR